MTAVSIVCRRAALLVASMVLVLVATRDAEACSCMSPRPACEAAWLSDAVFVGQVRSVETHPDRRQVSVLVVERLRGEVADVQEIETGLWDGDCGYDFTVGETYVIYATRSGTPARYRTGICSRTRLLSRAFEDLVYLRGLARRPAELGTILGTVRRSDPSPETGRAESAPFAGARVILEGASGRHEAVSASDGTYQVHVPPGRYEVTAEVPLGLYATSLGAVEVRDVRGCAQADVGVHADGRIVGRVVDARGTPLRGLSLRLLRRAAWSPTLFQGSTPAVATLLDGSYEFTRVAPGTYTVAVDTQSPDATGRGPGRIYLPGVSEAARAGVVALTASERAFVPDLVLPDAIRTVMLSGVVREADGRVVPGARVYARRDPPMSWSSAPAITDGGGRFLLAVVAGHAYSLAAELPAEGIRFRQGQAGPVDASGDAVLEIVLEPAPR